RALASRFSSGARSHTTVPAARNAARLSRRNTAPPPVAMTWPLRRVTARMASASRARKPVSPSRAKISGMGMPAASSTTASTSTKGRPSRAASRRPTVVLPAPMNPMRITLSATREGFYAPGLIPAQRHESQGDPQVGTGPADAHVREFIAGKKRAFLAHAGHEPPQFVHHAGGPGGSGHPFDDSDGPDRGVLVHGLRHLLATLYSSL